MSKSIYNKIPEGFTPSPKIDPKHTLQMFKQGSVTEITLDGKSFQVIDPRRMEALANLVERHEERFFELNQAVKQLRDEVRKLQNTVKMTRDEVTRLQEKLKENGNFL